MHKRLSGRPARTKGGTLRVEKPEIGDLIIELYLCLLPGGYTVFGRARRSGKSLWLSVLVRGKICPAVLSFVCFLRALCGENILKSMLQWDEPKLIVQRL